MRMLRTPPFFPPNRGKNHIWKYLQRSACGAIFSIMAGASDESKSEKTFLEAVAFTFKQCGLAFCPKVNNQTLFTVRCRDRKRRVCEGSDWLWKISVFHLPFRLCAITSTSLKPRLFRIPVSAPQYQLSAHCNLLWKISCRKLRKMEQAARRYKRRLRRTSNIDGSRCW